ncbi:MAG TPA: type VI immunity family protein, partial [Archangium sp.]|nr:type VI immunity family protein [Archangium sp.]
WLNFLGSPVLGALGGAAGLRARLRSPGTTVQELDGERAVVTLGTWPEAGDMEQGRTLPEYRELAHVLEPWLYMNRGNWSGFSDEDVRRWERRFLD